MYDEEKSEVMPLHVKVGNVKNRISQIESLLSATETKTATSDDAMPRTSASIDAIIESLGDELDSCGKRLAEIYERLNINMKLL